MLIWAAGRWLWEFFHIEFNNLAIGYRLPFLIIDESGEKR
jgi:hypothetical protein